MTLVGQIAFTMPFLVAAPGEPVGVRGLVGDPGRHRRHVELRPGQACRAGSARGLRRPGGGPVSRVSHSSATTFMTDVPAYAAEMLCLAVGAVAVEPDSGEPPSALARRLAGRRSAGHSASGSSRLAAPVAVLIAAMASDPLEPRRRYLFALDAVLAACVLIYLVAHDLPGQPTIHLQPFAPGCRRAVWSGESPPWPSACTCPGPCRRDVDPDLAPPDGRRWTRDARARDHRRVCRSGGGGRARVPLRPTTTACSHQLERVTGPASSSGNVFGADRGTRRGCARRHAPGAVPERRSGQALEVVAVVAGRSRAWRTRSRARRRGRGVLRDERPPPT